MIKEIQQKDIDNLCYPSNKISTLLTLPEATIPYTTIISETPYTLITIPKALSTIITIPKHLQL